MNTYEMWCITVTGVSFILMACFAIMVMWAITVRVKDSRGKDVAQRKVQLMHHFINTVGMVEEPKTAYCIDAIKGILNGEVDYNNLGKVKQGWEVVARMSSIPTEVRNGHQ